MLNDACRPVWDPEKKLRDLSESNDKLLRENEELRNVIAGYIEYNCLNRLYMDKSDPVNHPSHYTSGKYETIDIINSVLEDDGTYAFCIGNTLKYITRAGKKDDMLQDLKKAQWYLSKAISIKEGEKHV